MKFAIKPRGMDHSELINTAKNNGKKQEFKEIKAYYRLFSSNSGYAFYFKNDDPELTLLSHMVLDMQNLKIDGQEGNEFDVRLDPGQESSKVLLPVTMGESTGLGISFGTRVIKPKPTESGMIEMAKNSDKQKDFEGIKAYYRLFLASDGAAMWFANEDSAKTLVATFKL